MIFLKYEMPKDVWGSLKETIQNTYGQWIDCDVYEIGHICQQKDEEGICIVYSDLWAVDILWHNNPANGFTAYEVYPDPIGIHTFLGCEQYYLQAYCEKYPGSTYCIIPPTE